MLSLDRQNAYRRRLQADQPGWQPATDVYEQTIRQYLRPGIRLLDAGCGRGGAVEQLTDVTCTMVGIDPDRQSLAGHRLELPRAAGPLEQLPFPAAAFELVISRWVLEHLPRPVMAFREVARVLRPGGHFIILAPNIRHPVTLLNRLLAWARPLQTALVPRLYGRAEEDAFPLCYRANSIRRLSALAAGTNMATVAIRTISDPTYLAFNDWMFTLGRRVERWLPPSSWVHIVADFVRR